MMKLFPRRVTILLAALPVGLATGASRVPADPTWSVTSLQTGDYEAGVDSTVVRSGRRSLRLHARTAVPYGTVSIVRQIAAEPYRGRRVHLDGSVRVRDVTGIGATLVLAANTGSPLPAQANGDDSALVGTSEWRPMSLELVVPKNAVTVSIGASLNGGGTAWADDLRLDVVRDAVPAAAPAPLSFDFEDAEIAPVVPVNPLEAPRALSARGAENVAAFARLFGIVRHFYPSEAVRTANWDDFAVRGVRAVEGAPGADSLARTLRRLFHDVAPDVHVSVGGDTGARAMSTDTGTSAGVMRWVNRGLELDGPMTAGNAYRSTLVTTRGASKITAPWRGDIGSGLRASVPLSRVVSYSSPDSMQSLPVRPAPPAEITSPNDRASRLAGVVIAWNAVRHGFPYFDVVHADWNAALRPALASAARDSTPAAYRQTLLELMAKLPDGHGNVVMQAAPYRFGFLPFALDWIEDRLVVTAVAPTVPAGIVVGSVIESADGVPARGVVAARERQVSGATEGFRRSRAVLDLVFGRRDSAVVMRIRAPGAPAAALYALRFSNRVRVSEPQAAPMRDLDSGIAYVDLSRVSEAQLNGALPKLLAARGVVFDIRNHPRAATLEMLAHFSHDTLLSDHFETPIIDAPDGGIHAWSDNPWRIPPAEPKFAGKVVFLVGPAAVSSSESTLGIVEHCKLGPLVGERSAGTNGNVNSFWVPGRYQVVFTGMRVRKRDGGVHHGVGVAPTVPVHRTIRGVMSGRDEVLDRGVAEILHLRTSLTNLRRAASREGATDF